MGFKLKYPIEALIISKVTEPPTKTFVKECGLRAYGDRRLFAILRAVARLEYDKHLTYPGVYFLRIVDRKHLAFRLATPDEAREKLGYGDAPAPA